MFFFREIEQSTDAENPRYHAGYKAPKFFFRDANCLGCTCWLPDYMFANLNLVFPVLIKSKYKNRVRKVRICRNYAAGCPKDTGYSEEIRDERIRDGWRTAPL